MRQRHPTRTILLLATASIAGLAGQLVLPAGWSIVFLVVSLAPPGYALAARRLWAGSSRTPKRSEVASHLEKTWSAMEGFAPIGTGANLGLPDVAPIVPEAAPGGHVALAPDLGHDRRRGLGASRSSRRSSS